MLMAQTVTLSVCLITQLILRRKNLIGPELVACPAVWEEVYPEHSDGKSQCKNVVPKGKLGDDGGTKNGSLPPTSL